ncbi:mandelate racemase/muconate lactonizing enzyme family protein [Paenibacillus mendelii]|uniref:Mandelate racemase/muconate lactonizing enzyme family protein n=1 Tax=Paenibacillus mendelii TaxID=206163 RepID=A0ABV6J4A1_9BACL|nr:mandelate racemase/muconate lactonizing enzyme family protein [Paenibacillus mendelii]MCQ6561766.1 mandelate racemase/muconate lactonizing enzyme family protein [Paenibacillus mendelii]
MKIISVEAIPVNLPFHQPVSDMWGTYASSNHGIVIVRGESGEYGAGEIAFAWFGGAHSLCHEVNTQWANLLVGLDIRDISVINETLDRLCSFSKRHLLAKAGVEMAVWDLLGKTLNQPVYQLLGGKRRSQIALTGGVSMGGKDAMVEAALLKVSEGYRELKLKIGADDKRDIAVVSAIRGAIPDSVPIRVDVNMAWRDLKQAKIMTDELERYGVHIVEQPLHSDRLSESAWLRSNTGVKILIDEGVWDAGDAKRTLDAGAADMLHVYISEAGGLWGARQIFELAALHHTDCTIGSMPEGIVGAAASAHIAAAMANLSGHASDIRGFTGYREDVAAEELVIRDGALIVPDGPGLGITIDFDRLDRLTVR